MRRLILVLLMLPLAGLPAIVFSAPASADHIYDTFPGRGFVWFAARHNQAIAYVASTHCRDREQEAWNRVRETTVGKFPNRWPSGILFKEYNCTGTVDLYTDVKLSYEPASNFVRADGSSYGGWNENRAAGALFCNTFFEGKRPCGTHWATVHLNESRFTNSNYSHAYRRRLIMHETGHSLGLAHHCSSNAIMNDGTSSCNGGAWTNINGYQGTDRQGVRNLYPDWMY